MKKFTSVLLALCLCIGLFNLFAVAETGTELHFGEDGQFVILQLTDPQDDVALAKELAGFIEEAIAVAQPDLIVLTGDIIEDSRPVMDNFSDDKPFTEGVKDRDYETALANVEQTVAQIFAPLEASGIPYTVTQGNNDYKAGISNEDWLRIYAQYPNCISLDESPDEDGHIDTYLPVLASDSDDPVFGLWMIDNGKSFNEEQAAWMRDYDTKGVPGIVFEHVPVDDVGDLFEECKPWDDGAFADGLKAYRLNKDIATGHAEISHTPGIVTDEFILWQEKNVVGAFFGHEHTCGYTGVVDGITLGLTYGCQFAKFGPYGMRTIVIDEESATFTTDLYVFEDGAFTLQTDEPYATYDSIMQKIGAYLVNLCKYVFRSLLYLVKI